MSCDNASNNDSMINELSRLVPKFPGATNQTRCFLHVLNLVVKSVIKQFDLPEMQEDNILDDAHQALLELAEDLEHEELQSQKNGDSDEDDDSTEGWINERELMTEREKKELDKSIGPMRLMLTKVRKTRSELEPFSKNCIASQNGLRYQKLNNNFTAKVVFCTQRIKTKCSYDAARCFNPLELHIRYAGICDYLP